MTALVLPIVASEIFCTAAVERKRKARKISRCLIKSNSYTHGFSSPMKCPHSPTLRVFHQCKLELGTGI